MISLNKNICEIHEISNAELTTRISILQSKERSVVLKFLIHLGEFDKRGRYLKAGYSSSIDYCIRKLNLCWSSIKTKRNHEFISGQISGHLS